MPVHPYPGGYGCTEKRRHMMGLKVGIDLGTTFCAVARLDESTGKPVIIPNTLGDKITPSVIQFTEDGEVIVGEDAKEAFEAGESGCTSTFKRNMGDDGPYCRINGKSYTSVELSAILLRYLKEQTEQVTGEQIEEAVVTVPAYFYSREKRATMQAAKMAGLKIHQIINEPTAAAMTYGLYHWRENAVIMVYDLGGGTFDVTLVQMQKNSQLQTLRTTGDHTLGGKDWDGRICAILLDRIEQETGLAEMDNSGLRLLCMQQAEQIKKRLTERQSVDVRMRLPDYGPYSTSITKEEFEQSTRDLLEKTGVMCERVLLDQGITWKEITDILLVGGSTRMKQVSGYLKEKSGHTPLQQVNPDEAVALGAAIQVHIPLPDYDTVGIGGAPAVSDDSHEKKGLFNFGRRKPASASGQPSGASAPQGGGPNFRVVGEVGRETQIDNALSMRPVDVAAHAMGVIAVNKEGTAYINKLIVPAGSVIPVKCAEAFHFYTSAGGENEVEVFMLQGEGAPLSCQIVGKYVVTGIRHDPKHNPTVLRIQYSYDVNGVVHVQARQEDDTCDLPIREEPIPDDMSKYGRPIDPEEMGTTSTAEDIYVVMAVDVSGSMSGTPLKNALNAMTGFVDQFQDYPGHVEMGVVAVSDRTKRVQTVTNNLQKVKAGISSITSSMTGVCNAADPFDDIKDMLQMKRGKRIAIVLADGIWEHQAKAIERAKKCHRLEINVIGMGFGSADQRFMKAISYGDMEAIMLQSSSELGRGFGKIAQEISGGSGEKRGRSGEGGQAMTWEAPDEM